MTLLPGVGAFQPVGPANARPVARGGGGGFSVGGSAPAGTPVAIAETSLAGLLSLQEAGGDAVQDRAARRHGHDLLAELSALQRDLLSGAPSPARLARLSDLAARAPEAADPGLRDIVADIALRASIESARYANG